MKTLSTLPGTAGAPFTGTAPVYHFNKLQLAPIGWREMVEKMAVGHVDLIGEHSYCQECGSIIQGEGRESVGHHIDCTTMRARRMLGNYPLLVARNLTAVRVLAALKAPDLDIDATDMERVASTAGQETRTGTGG